MLTYSKPNLKWVHLVLIISILSSCSLFRKSPKLSRSVLEVIETARSYTGTPYRSGGMDKRGMDCSGLICTSFKQVGKLLPRVSWQQAEAGRQVSVKDIRLGDLVFFVTGKKTGSINHAGIVCKINDDEIWFIHASTSKGVREDNLQTDYWRSAFVKAVRVL